MAKFTPKFVFYCTEQVQISSQVSNAAQNCSRNIMSSNCQAPSAFIFILVISDNPNLLLNRPPIHHLRPRRLPPTPPCTSTRPRQPLQLPPPRLSRRRRAVSRHVDAAAAAAGAAVPAATAGAGLGLGVGAVGGAADGVRLVVVAAPVSCGGARGGGGVAGGVALGGFWDASLAVTICKKKKSLMNILYHNHTNEFSHI